VFFGFFRCTSLLDETIDNPADCLMYQNGGRNTSERESNNCKCCEAILGRADKG
jgi:hypothetical protein